MGWPQVGDFQVAIRDYQSYLKNHNVAAKNKRQKLRASTINHYVNSMYTLMDWARTHKHIPSHVARPLPLSKEDAKKTSDRWTPTYAGAVASAMIKYPNAFRSLHPVQKFVAIGAMAEELMQNHTPDSYAYDVLRVMCEIGGRNLKLGTDEKVVGVGTTHVAIGALGFHQKRPRAGVNYRNEKGEIVTFERNWSGACEKGLINFIPLYREAGAILSEGKVGHAESKITDMRKTLDVELEILSKDPTFFFCNDPACIGCRLTWGFSTGSRISVYYHQLKRNPRKCIKAVLRRIVRGR